jgi:hypothetical protein
MSNVAQKNIYLMHKTRDIGITDQPALFTICPRSIAFVVFKAAHSDGKRTTKFSQVACVSLELGQPRFP